MNSFRNALNEGPVKYFKQLLIDSKKDIDSNTMLVEDFKSILLPLNKSARLNLSKEVLVLKE